MKFFLVFLGGAFLFTACQQKPTQITVQPPILTESSQVATKNWLQQLLLEEPVILDTRSAFDFNLSHVPSAINVRWEDFSQQDPHSRGVLETDHFALARRLALIGIDPDTKVLILGKAHEGNGEEGRVAWTLKYLGIHHVFTMNNKELRALRVQDMPLAQNKSYWKPEEDESLVVDFANFKKKALATPALPDYVILDARSAAQFGTENMRQKKGLTASVVNLSWKEFFNDKGFVNEAVVEKLKQFKIGPETQIDVISNNGLESGAVTYALRTLGFKKSANFSGGYEQWNVNK